MDMAGRAVFAGWTAAGVLMLSACSVTEPVAGSGSELPERLGTALAGTDGFAIGSAMLWSGDGTELYFEAADGSMRAVSVTQGVTRTIDAPRTRADASAPSGGNAVYFVADREPGHARAYRAAGGQLHLLTDRAPATTALGGADGALVLGGPDDRLAAFIVAPDSLFVHDVGSGQSHYVRTGCVRVVAFAPQGDVLLCRLDGPRDQGYALVNLASSQATPVAALVGENGTMRLVRWDEDALRVLFTVNNRFRMRNVDGATSIQLWSPSTAAYLMRSLDFLHYAWSADGTRFAFWTHECLEINRVGQCTQGQSVLYIIELKNNTGTMAAVVKGSRGGEQISLAPNGRAVAYAFNGRIYYQSLP
jgi:hypothetical protein